MIPIDQQVDVSFKALVTELLSAPRDVVSLVKEASIDIDAYENLPSAKFAMPNERAFPINTLADTMLSKLYLNSPANASLGMDKIAAANELIDKYLVLQNVNPEWFAKPLEKVAEAPTVYFLLESIEACPVSTKGDLIKAASVFEDSYKKLSIPHRVEFAQNFIEIASELKHNQYPEIMTKYACSLTPDIETAASLIDQRIAYASVTKRSLEGFEKVAEHLKTSKTQADFKAVAEELYAADVEAGFDLSKYASYFPDAFATVFAKAFEKVAEEEQAELTKADVVGKYGEGILEEVEKEDGSLDLDKLRAITRNIA